MLAAGVPGVVTTNCAGDMKDIPGVWITDEPSPTALADTIIRVHEFLRPSALSAFLESPSLRHYFGQIGLQDAVSERHATQLCLAVLVKPASSPVAFLYALLLSFSRWRQ